MTGEDQSADFGQEEAAPEPAQEGYGVLRAGAQVEVAGPLQIRGQDAGPGEVTQRRGEGRRVNLRRESGGGYSIWMGSQCIQTFCGQWEDITRFQLPEGIQQQVRIIIQSMGEAREWDQAETRGENAVDVADEVALQNIAHARPDRQALVRMFEALPAHNQEIIAGQIEANYANVVEAEATPGLVLPARGREHALDRIERLLMGVVEEIRQI